MLISTLSELNKSILSLPSNESTRFPKTLKFMEFVGSYSVANAVYRITFTATQFASFSLSNAILAFGIAMVAFQRLRDQELKPSSPQEPDWEREAKNFGLDKKMHPGRPLKELVIAYHYLTERVACRDDAKDPGSYIFWGSMRRQTMDVIDLEKIPPLPEIPPRATSKVHKVSKECMSWVVASSISFRSYQFTGTKPVHLSCGIALLVTFIWLMTFHVLEKKPSQPNSIDWIKEMSKWREWAKEHEVSESHSK